MKYSLNLAHLYGDLLNTYGDIGNINKKYIVGKVWFVISPKDKFGFLKG